MSDGKFVTCRARACDRSGSCMPPNIMKPCTVRRPAGKLCALEYCRSWLGGIMRPEKFGAQLAQPKWKTSAVILLLLLFHATIRKMCTYGKIKKNKNSIYSISHLVVYGPFTEGETRLFSMKIFFFFVVGETYLKHGKDFFYPPCDVITSITLHNKRWCT